MRRRRENPENERQRYLSSDEAARLEAVLEALVPDHRETVELIRVIAATGCRKGEALRMTWSQVDLTAGLWTKPSAKTKQKEIHRAPLSEFAVEVLRGVRERRGDASPRDPVFPLSIAGKESALKRLWKSIVKDAKLEDFHLHDLRHDFASTVIGAGACLPIVGALLGHTQPKTTMRYAHLADTPLRNALAAAVNKSRI